MSSTDRFPVARLSGLLRLAGLDPSTGLSLAPEAECIVCSTVTRHALTIERIAYPLCLSCRATARSAQPMDEPATPAAADPHGAPSVPGKAPAEPQEPRSAPGSTSTPADPADAPTGLRLVTTHTTDCPICHGSCDACKGPTGPWSA